MPDKDTKQPGRIVKRWVAECDFTLVAEVSRGVQVREACPFNDRKGPTLHTNAQAAVREAITHAVTAGHIGAREAQVRRTYTPRTIESEEVIS